MKITNVQIHIPREQPQPDPTGHAAVAYANVTFDAALVVRDLKVIGNGRGGHFVSMPCRPLTERCGACQGKNRLRARFCNWCGGRLPPVELGKFHAQTVYLLKDWLNSMIEREVLAALQNYQERERNAHAGLSTEARTMDTNRA